MHLACLPLDFMLSTVWEHLQEKSIAGDLILNFVLKVSMFAREGSCRWHITRFSYCKCRLAQLVGSPHKLIWSQKNPQRLFQSKASPSGFKVKPAHLKWGSSSLFHALHYIAQMHTPSNDMKTPVNVRASWMMSVALLKGLLQIKPLSQTLFDWRAKWLSK